MSHFGMSRGYSLMTGGAANSSAITSAAALVADWQIQTLSWQTVTGSASTLTVQGSLDARDQRAAIAEASWSNLTMLIAAGMYTIDPGSVWIRTVRGSPESASTVLIAGRVY